MESIIIFGIILLGLVIFIYLLLNTLTTKTIDGHWLCETVGMGLNIKYGIVRSYQVEGQSILPFPLLAGRIKNNHLNTPISNFQLSIQGHQLKLADTSSSMYYLFDVAKHPIKSNRRQTQHDPVANLEIFYTIFKNHYPFFELYAVDFEQRYTIAKTLVDKDTTDEELLSVLKAMLEGLNDDHISIETTEEWSPYTGTPPYAHIDYTKQFVNVIDQFYTQEMTYLNKRTLRYALMTEHIGYINIASMGLSIHAKTNSEQMLDAFINAMEGLGPIETLVIDLRFNGGGHDAVGLQIAGCFTEKDYIAYTKQAYHPTDKTPIIQQVVTPNTRFQFRGHVIVLSSGYSVSAAETFMIALRRLNKVTIIGESSAGFYSDALPKLLPNGLECSLSYEVYKDADGNRLEGQGLTPDVYIPLNPDNLEKHIDPALDYVLENY